MAIAPKMRKSKRDIRNQWGVPSDETPTDRDRFAALDSWFDAKWNGVLTNTLDEFESELGRDGLKIED